MNFNKKFEPIIKLKEIIYQAFIEDWVIESNKFVAGGWNFYSKSSLYKTMFSIHVLRLLSGYPGEKTKKAFFEAQ